MKVLAGCEIVIEATQGCPEAVKAMIVKFGGKIVERITPTTLCVISTKGMSNGSFAEFLFIDKVINCKVSARA